MSPNTGRRPYNRRAHKPTRAAVEAFVRDITLDQWTQFVWAGVVYAKGTPFERLTYYAAQEVAALLMERLADAATPATESVPPA